MAADLAISGLPGFNMDADENSFPRSAATVSDYRFRGAHIDQPATLS